MPGCHEPFLMEIDYKLVLHFLNYHISYEVLKDIGILKDGVLEELINLVKQKGHGS